MKRSAIINSIQRHLSEDDSHAHSSSQARSLIDVVGRVAKDVRVEKVDPSTIAKVIPIEQVAAFVDGQLESDKVDEVCRAVMIDNGVLAELVAAVRVTLMPKESLPAVPEALTARLLAGHPAETISTKDIARMMHEPEAAAQRWRMGLMVPLAVVAMIATLVYFNRSSPKMAAERSITEVDPIPVDNDDVSQPETVTDSMTESDKVVPDTPEMEPVPIEIALEPMPESATVPVESEKQMIAPESESVPTDVATITASPESVANADQPAPSKISAVQWTEITGLLGAARQTEDGDDSNREIKFVRVRGSSVTKLDQPRRFRTPTLSKARAELQTGATLVINEDSDVTFTAGGDDVSVELDLKFGEVLLKNLAMGSIVGLNVNGKRVGLANFGENGTANLRATVTGLEMRYANLQAIVMDDEQLLAVPSTSDPDWLMREPMTLDKVSLAQVADTDDLAGSLESQINRLASSNRLNDSQSAELAKLVQMRLSIAGEDVVFLAANRIEVVRRGAVESIALLSKSDPRFEPVWNLIQAEVADPNRRAQIDGWMQLIRTGGRPSEPQLKSMLAGLSSAKATVRGLSDVMLRYYVDDPPSFDPTGELETIRSAVAAYQLQLAVP